MKIIQFYKHRFVYFAISICFILAGVIALLFNGISLDITFKGGTILKYTYVDTVDAEAAAGAVQNALGTPTSGQIQTTMTGEDSRLIISLAGNEAITSQQQETVTSTLQSAFPNAKLSLSEALTVEPYVGKKFFTNGLLAIGISFLLILIYVGFRFKNIGGASAGTMAIVALIHDALIVTATFVVFRIPLNDSFVAAVLTIIGFSINDTIVIYDRIRENERLFGKKMEIDELVDKSITQSITRSINTSMAVFASITIVYIFAQIYNIESIRSFALPMMFGTISGSYSTICIAGPLWVMWKKHKAKRAGTAKA
jgi:preprotein translocase SecF subunit